MSSPVGNVTYKYQSPTKFYNASVTIDTLSSSAGTTGNTSILYSLNGNSWTVLNSTTAKGAALNANIPIANSTVFYVMLRSDTDSLNSENPVTDYSINYVNYNYAS